jgi:hypothetical protein
MASLKDAERAREQSADHLRRLGAHAISVEEAEGEEESERASRRSKRQSVGRKSYVVVAWFEHDPLGLPERLEVSHEGGTKKVPLRIRREGRFRPE